MTYGSVKAGVANRMMSIISITLGLEKNETEALRLDLRYDLNRAEDSVKTTLDLIASKPLPLSRCPHFQSVLRIRPQGLSSSVQP